MEFTITVQEYFNRLATQMEPILLDGVTSGWGALWSAEGVQLHNSDMINVKG